MVAGRRTVSLELDASQKEEHWQQSFLTNEQDIFPKHFSVFESVEPIKMSRGSEVKCQCLPALLFPYIHSQMDLVIDVDFTCSVNNADKVFQVY